MAHHLDYIEDSRLDITDVHCFAGTSGTVFVLNVAPREATGFHHEGVYELRVDTDGNTLENLKFRAAFPYEDGVQRVQVEMLTGRDARDRDAHGTVITPQGARLERVVDCANGIKLFAGERGEPFFNDPRLLVEIKKALQTGTAPDFSTYDPATAVNAFGDSNISAIVLEVPSAITTTGTIGFWGSTVLPTDAGGWRQLQHAAAPVIGFLWDFAGGSGADYNASHPKDQKAVFGPQVVRETAAVVEAMGSYDDGPYGRSTPEEYAEYVRDTIFADVLRYDVGTAANYGPRTQNGRGLTEESMESIFELVLNQHVEMGLDASDATGTLLAEFPYLSEPI